ncbi:hypothetical protein LOZ12_000654 [Ophidiomyces ophidiicola]|nr:hypothetical protein LOZ64_004127 [Ophidiomyces ophidiicola]KAI1944170.1 hypothetical protein LOZ62_004229 [Ophidiomyces ophidiicola]KAI2008372.1 hypothetical protein LOZ50_002072 [Ophidiomyces ophidiicola]KAI2012516.1 hypothetical protein LOZ49_002603 [Ophidiomyces ophidiicola]KAI2020293.1 hypothetical protein LOZ46_002936 [Ophidiomyces ophidiicola]
MTKHGGPKARIELFATSFANGVQSIFDGMAPRVIILAGLPPRSSLNWEESELLQAPLPPPYYTKLVEQSDSPVRWRLLAPMNVPTIKPPLEGASFFMMRSIQRYSGNPIDLKADDELSNFYDHSFAVHEGISGSLLSDTISFTDDSELTPSFGEESLNNSLSRRPNQPCERYTDGRRTQGHWSNLGDIPRAAYLESVAPQIVTVNLLAAILTIQPRRRVRTRWGREMDIVEILVGDETKIGFRVSFWVPASNEHAVSAPGSLDASLKVLRLRDVIFIRSLALSSFRGQVYGQSLRQETTKVDILDRESDPTIEAEDANAAGGNTAEANWADPQTKKIRRVRRWIRNFVAPGTAVDENAFRSFTAAAQLPPDTQ